MAHTHNRIRFICCLFLQYFNSNTLHIIIFICSFIFWPILKKIREKRDYLFKISID